MGGKVWGNASEALNQGDPEAPALFSVVFHPDLVMMDRALLRNNGGAIGGNDYVYCWGPSHIVFLH